MLYRRRRCKFSVLQNDHAIKYVQNHRLFAFSLLGQVPYVCSMHERHANLLTLSIEIVLLVFIINLKICNPY